MMREGQIFSNPLPMDRSAQVYLCSDNHLTMFAEKVDDKEFGDWFLQNCRTSEKDGKKAFQHLYETEDNHIFCDRVGAKFNLSDDPYWVEPHRISVDRAIEEIRDGEATYDESALEYIDLVRYDKDDRPGKDLGDKDAVKTLFHDTLKDTVELAPKDAKFLSMNPERFQTITVEEAEGLDAERTEAAQSFIDGYHALMNDRSDDMER